MTPVHGNVLIARPLWPVLGRVGNLLSRRGYSVETAGSWSALLAEPGRRAGLAAVLLGEYGSVAEFILKHGYGPGGKNDRQSHADWRANGGKYLEET